MRDDYARLHGRFELVDEVLDEHRKPKLKVVGLFKGINNIKPYEVSYIKGFYNLLEKGFSCEQKDEYPAKTNGFMFDGFLVFVRTFEDKLRRRREEIGFTREQVAQKLRIDVDAYQRFETGAALPSPYFAECLDAVLDLSDGTVESWVEG